MCKKRKKLGRASRGHGGAQEPNRLPLLPQAKVLLKNWDVRGASLF